MSSGPCISNLNPISRQNLADGLENIYYTSPIALSMSPDSYSDLIYGSPAQSAPGSYYGDVLSEVGPCFDGTFSSFADSSSLLDSYEILQEAGPQPVPALSPASSRQQGQRALYPCICAESFHTLEALEQHARSTLHRVYVCRMPNCRKSFYRRDSFARHKSLHYASESFLCTHCPRAFKRKDHLDQHTRNIHALSRGRRVQRELDHAAGSHNPQKQAVKDLRQACISRFPGDSDAVQKLQEYLQITDNSTSKEVAQSVVEILLGSKGLCYRD